ncbi:MAG: cardiolipin synthase [Polyangiales bacterium]
MSLDLPIPIVTILGVAWVSVAAVVIVLQRRSAAATIAWLLVFAFLPVFGFVLYRLIGPLRLKRKRIRHKFSRATVEAVVGARAKLRDGTSDDIQLARVAGAPDEAPPLAAERVDCYFDGASFYTALAEAITSAQQHIHLEFYIWEPDQVGVWLRDLLIARAQAGVKVRLLVDGTGSSRLGRKFLRPLTAAGVEFARFNPVSLRFIRTRRVDFRTHRKIVVCDGRVGFTGGMNVTDVHSSKYSASAWRDTHLRLEGMAVWPLQRMFLEDWYFAAEALPSEPEAELFPASRGERKHTVQVVGSGPDHEQPNMLHTFFAAITRSEQRIWLTTPYFVPEEPIMIALCTAALRKVDVRVLIPQRGDSRLIDLAARSYLPELLACGVKVYEHTTCFIHAKTFVLDDDTGIVGSANLDTRSLRLNFELCAVLYDRALNTTLAQAFEADLVHSRRIHAADLAGQPWPRRFAEASARLLSPLL